MDMLLTTFSILPVLSVEKLYGWATFGVSAVGVLAMLIVAHEFGHFIVARMVGVRVEKFSIGFGKKLIGRKYGDTEYMLCLIPLGGYVKFYGDDPGIPAENEEDSFLAQKVWKRLSIVVAGPLFNIILAVFIIASAAMIGLPVVSMESGEEKPIFIAAAMIRTDQKNMPPQIGQVMEKSPAEKYGLQPNDTILAINGAPIKLWMEMVEVIQKSPGIEIKLKVKRMSGEILEIPLVPNKVKATTADGKETFIGRIGVSQQSIIKGSPHVVAYSPVDALSNGVRWTWDFVSLTAWSLTKLLSRDIPAKEIAGPIGIMQIAGKAAESGIVNLLMFIALISVNLGILNLLPIPVLDGGHIFFFSIEALIGRPIQLKAQEIAQQVGIFLLLSLMALAFYNDIMRIVNSS